MTALYITLGILFVLLLLLFLPLAIVLRYDGSVSVKFFVLFLPFSFYPRKRRERDYSKRSVDRKKRRLEKKAARKGKTTKKKPTSQKGKRDVLSPLKLILHILTATHPRLVRAFRIRLCELRVTVATEDAAKTAILYGAASQITALVLEVCERFLWCKRNKRRVDVVADFCGTESSVSAHIRFTSNLYRILRLGIAAGIVFLKHKLQNKKTVEQPKGEQQNG